MEVYLSDRRVGFKIWENVTEVDHVCLFFVVFSKQKQMQPQYVRSHTTREMKACVASPPSYVLALRLGLVAQALSFPEYSEVSDVGRRLTTSSEVQSPEIDDVRNQHGRPEVGD